MEGFSNYDNVENINISYIANKVKKKKKANPMILTNSQQTLNSISDVVNLGEHVLKTQETYF